MIFKLKATVQKELWSSGDSYLYSVQETISQDRTKNWSIFTEQELAIGAEATFEGYVSESKDKKLVDQNGKAIYKTSFNADRVEVANEIESQEPYFNEREDIPF